MASRAVSWSGHSSNPVQLLAAEPGDWKGIGTHNLKSHGKEGIWQEKQTLLGGKYQLVRGDKFTLGICNVARTRDYKSLFTYLHLGRI